MAGVGAFFFCSPIVSADSHTTEAAKLSASVYASSEMQGQLSVQCQSQAKAGPEMVLIAAGSFQMGSPTNEPGRFNDESLQHQVIIAKPFALSRCEVTVAEFSRFVEATGYKTQAEQSGGCNVWDAKAHKFEQKPDANWNNPGFTQTEQHPVTCVSWHDANEYISWLNQDLGLLENPYRLPTETEWEYAARAGTQTAYFGGNANQCTYANGADQALKSSGGGTNWRYADCNDSFAYTAPVASFKVNPWGLYDMLGNVWEWVEDCWHDSYQGALSDGSAWLSGKCDQRSVRGGGWSSKPPYLRSAFRFRIRPNGTNYDQGFRLARTL